MNYREYLNIKWNNAIGIAVFNYLKLRYDDEYILSFTKRKIEHWEIIREYNKYLSINNWWKKYSLNIFRIHYHLWTDIYNKKHYKNKKKRDKWWIANERIKEILSLKLLWYSNMDIAKRIWCTSSYIWYIIRTNKEN